MENRNSLAPAPRSIESEDVTTWSLPEGAIARLGQGLAEALVFSPDGQHLAVGTRVGLWLYEIETMSPISLWATERGLITCVAFSPNGRWIATSDWDTVIKVWDVQRGVCLTHIETAWNNFTFSPDNPWFTTSCSETATIKVWHPKTGEMLTKFTGHVEKGGRFMPIAFSPDTHLIASIGCEAADNNSESVLVWNVEQREQIACFTGHASTIYSLCFSPCGRFLASGGRKDGTVCVWDTVIYTTKENVGGHAIVDFSNGSRLVRASGEGSIKVWHFGKPHTQTSGYQPISFPNTVAFSSDGKTLIAEYRAGRRLYSHGDVLFWDLASKRSSRAIETEPIGTEQFFYTTSDGKSHVVSLDDGTVRLWEVGYKEVLIAAFTGHEKKWKRAALTPIGDRLACIDEEGTLIAWDIETMDKLCQFTHVHEGFPDREPATLEFNPNGKLLLSEMDYYPSARLWDAENGEEIREFPSGEIGALWDCGIIVVFLRAVLIWFAAKCEWKNHSMKKLPVCGMLNGTKFSRCYRFGMRLHLPIHPVVHTLLVVEKTRKVFCCGISNVVKSISGCSCQRNVTACIR